MSNVHEVSKHIADILANKDAKFENMTEDQVDALASMVASVTTTLREFEITSVAHSLKNEDLLKEFFLVQEEELSVQEIIDVIHEYLTLCVGSSAEFILKNLQDHLPVPVSVPYSAVVSEVELTELSQRVGLEGGIYAKDDDGNAEISPRFKQILDGKLKNYLLSQVDNDDEE